MKRKIRTFSFIIASALISTTLINQKMMSENQIEILETNVNAEAGIIDWLKSLISDVEYFLTSGHKLKITQFFNNRTKTTHISRNSKEEILSDIEYNIEESGCIAFRYECVSAASWKSCDITKQKERRLENGSWVDYPL